MTEGQDWWINNEDLCRLEEHSAAQAAEAFEHRLSAFRRAVFEKLTCHADVVGGLGWAIFHLNDGINSGGVMATEGGGLRRILLATGYTAETHNAGLSTPIIRIFSNEFFETDRGPELLSQDFTADSLGRTQYYVDVVNTDEQVQAKYGNSLAVFFNNTEEGELGFNENFKDFTLGNGIAAAHQTENLIKPFGHYSCMEDKIYALGQAEELLAEVVDREPAHFSHSARGES